VFNRILPQKTTSPEEHKTTISTPELTPNMADLTTTKNHLSADVEIKGSIKFQNELTIDGKVEGEITSPGVLVIGENSEVRGEIKTKSVTVHGKVQGNITVEERCELKGRAQLIGDLKAARLVIEEGATFVGKSEVSPKGGVKPMEAARTPEPTKVSSILGR
jgi:cytoskeletal protein CcmA (bactofilin family)